MSHSTISFQDTGYFSKLICDYLVQDQSVDQLYQRYPSIDNFESQLLDKSDNYDAKHRAVLVEVLKEQYQGLECSVLTEKHLELLSDDKTFTITTGHQLNLFTGPLYFLYKIIATVNLCKRLKEQYADYNFVPIYWMASEDHDFEEIHYFNFKGKKVQWNHPAGGAVGRLDTTGLDSVLASFGAELGVGKRADYLRSLFKEAYTEHKTLSSATLYLVNELFGSLGLVCIDADDARLKKLVQPYFKQDMLSHIAHSAVKETIDQLKSKDKGYKIQVNPREINLFYLSNHRRDRIVKEEGYYLVNDTAIRFTEAELLQELEQYPERFSPNVLLRPLYQEVILPNLCYIGGGGELAYWLELKSYFDAVGVTFPMLQLRNSLLVKTKKQAKKQSKLGVEDRELFLKQNRLINHRVRQISDIPVDVSEQLKAIETNFEQLRAIADQTDPTFLGAVNAEYKKQLKSYQRLEKRLLKAQRRVLKDEVARLIALQNQLFPDKTLQERKVNFSELYLEYGEALIPMLVELIDSLLGEFLVAEL